MDKTKNYRTFLMNTLDQPNNGKNRMPFLVKKTDKNSAAVVSTAANTPIKKFSFFIFIRDHDFTVFTNIRLRFYLKKKLPKMKRGKIRKSTIYSIFKISNNSMR